MADETNKSTVPEKTPPVAAEKPAKKQFYKGNKSKQAHDDQFRRRAGEKVMAANDARLDQNLFSHLTSISTKLSYFNHAPQPLTAVLPQTTRGIGFSVLTSHNHLLARRPALGVTVFQAYRTALAQHALIRLRSPATGHRIQPSLPDSDTGCPPFMDFESVTEMNTRHFTPVAAALSAFGNLTFNGKDYHGFLPPPGMLGEVVEPQPGPSKGKRHQSKRRDQPDLVRQRELRCNPYTVCLQNLRQVCDDLEDPTVPLLARNYFISRNPIPGARFAEGLLLNGDQIMPDNYNASMLASDFRAMKLCEDLTAKHYSHCFSEVNFSGKASVSTLVNADFPARILADIVIEEGPLRNTCLDKVSAVQQCLGIISLVGEACEHGGAVPVYGSRLMTNGVQTISADWTQLVQGLLAK